jgi:hypothetical protein
VNALPLPSREETERTIQEEAARKQREIDAQFEAKQAQIRQSRYDERVKFHQELRDVLKQNGSSAGPEIDRLCLRYGYEYNPEMFARAARTWSSSKMKLEFKVQRVRSLDLPETVILNFLSDDLHSHLRARNGPRDSNDVRVRAARQLLNFEIPALPPANPATNRSDRGAPTMEATTRVPSPKN